MMLKVCIKISLESLIWLTLSYPTMINLKWEILY